MARGRKEIFNFRDLTTGLVLIVNNNNMNVMKRVFESYPTDNAILACGYIDHTAGISFEVLCLAEYSPNGDITLRRGNSSTSVKLRYDSITGIVVLLDDEILPALQNKIDMVRSGYKVNEAILKARNTTAIDEFRHPQFPDDVVLTFYKEGIEPEGIWCRIETEIDGNPAAMMLNEPYADFGVHEGDIVKFAWTMIDGKMMGIALLADDSEENNAKSIVNTWNAMSFLGERGYSTSVPAWQRELILKGAVRDFGKRRVIDHINFLIEMRRAQRGGSAKYANAIAIWEADLAFVKKL